MKAVTKHSERPNNATLASDLAAIDRDIQRLAEDREYILGELMANLKQQGVRQIRLEDGTMYIRAERKTLVVKDDEKAWKWATENNCLQIDKSRAFKIFQRTAMPRFFGKKVTEYLTVRRPKDDGVSEQEG